MNIVAEQVAFAEMAARDIDEMAKQILDPPDMRRRFESMARGIRFVIENFRTAEEAIADFETRTDFATIEQLRDAVKVKRLADAAKALIREINAGYATAREECDPTACSVTPRRKEVVELVAAVTALEPQL